MCDDDPLAPSEDEKEVPTDPGGLEKAQEKLLLDTSPSKDVGNTVTGCKLARLKVSVRTSTSAGVAEATVKVTGASKSTPKHSREGLYDCGQVKPGEYTITVEKPWYVEPGTSEETPKKEITLLAGDKKTVPFLLDPIEIHMFLDADRDGEADQTREGMDKWEWGKGKKGAIVLCNNDDDYPDKKPKKKSDNEDQEVNHHNDKDELAPIEIGRQGPKPPGTWKAELKILDNRESKLRIFAGRSAGSKELLGKGTASSFVLPNLDFEKLKLWMEATQYADEGWSDGLVKLELKLVDSKGNERTEDAVVRVAPWMMLHHGVWAEKVYVVNLDSGNETFRKELDKALPGKLSLNDEVHCDDKWEQDVMEIGCSSLPRATGKVHAINAIVRSAQERALGRRVKEYRDRDVGYEEPVTVPPKDQTPDSLGNLEVTPPCKDESGKHYPFGRIYYGPNGGGETFNTKMAAFLEAQEVQKPFGLDTSWLYVGHVDEFVTFVPDSKSGGKNKFRALVASPYEAYRILDELQRSGKGGKKLLVGRSTKYLKTGAITAAGLSLRSLQISIEDLLVKGYPDLNMIENAKKLRDFNDTVQDKIDKTIEDKFPEEIGYSVPRSAKVIRAADEKVREAAEKASAAEKEAKEAQEVADSAKEDWEKLPEKIEDAKAWVEICEVLVELAKEELVTAKEEEPENPQRNEKAKIDFDKEEKKLEEAKKDVVNQEKEQEKKSARLKMEYESRQIEADKKREEAKKEREKAKVVAREEKDAKAKDAEKDVIRVPVLFHPYSGISTKAIAMTAGVVNMLVVNGTCVFPVPYGPEVGGVDKFQEDLEKKLKSLGESPKPIDDWEEFHVWAGEIHCGTNTRRAPQDWQWWEFEP